MQQEEEEIESISLYSQNSWEKKMGLNKTNVGITFNCKGQLGQGNIN